MHSDDWIDLFWKELTETHQTKYFSQPKRVYSYPIFQIKTLDIYSFDDAFWNVFHQFPFHICHISCKDGEYDLRFKVVER